MELDKKIYILRYNFIEFLGGYSLLINMNKKIKIYVILYEIIIKYLNLIEGNYIYLEKAYFMYRICLCLYVELIEK